MAYILRDRDTSRFVDFDSNRTASRLAGVNPNHGSPARKTLNVEHVNVMNAYIRAPLPDERRPFAPAITPLSLLELTRVIELYNYRSGTTRTGQYHVQAGTEVGFAPGP